MARAYAATPRERPASSRSTSPSASWRRPGWGAWPGCSRKLGFAARHWVGGRSRYARHRTGRVAPRPIVEPALASPPHVNRRTDDEGTPSHGFRASPASVRRGRAGAAHERRDARVPLRQAPQDLRRQPEQGRRRHARRRSLARGDHPQGRRPAVQQRRPGLEPHLLLELHAARTAAASPPARWPTDRRSAFGSYDDFRTQITAGRHRPVRLRLGLAGRERRHARDHQDGQRRPARSSTARRRC